MQQVGVLFNEGKLLLPFVLKSAEVMRACSTLLESHLKGETNADKGVVVLATVKGDVHDIGKNLVDIILTGNGYKVINMGTKVSGEEIAKAAIEHKADAIGMSGLLVKSVEIMKENIALFASQGLKTKILLGGAALSEDYVMKECAPLMPELVYYCKDAFAGVSAMNGSATISIWRADPAAANPFAGKHWAVQPYKRSIAAKFYGNSEVERVTIANILPFLHKKALFETRWGARSAAEIQEAEARLEQMLAQLATIVKPQLVYGFYPVSVRGNELWLPNEITHKQVDGKIVFAGSKAWSCFASFPKGANGECFADLYRVAEDEHGHFSYIAYQAVLPLQAVSLGSEVVDYLNSHYKQNHYEQYYQYHGLLAELTDALAAYTQERVASLLFSEESWCEGVPQSIEKTWRYSFGYPLCPDLEGNKAICNLLEAERIGITLTENAQMEPIYSTCAMLSWHPASRY
jgi:5-methyltetrahydrofolate--homocysteine methyltransferase